MVPLSKVPNPTFDLLDKYKKNWMYSYISQSSLDWSNYHFDIFQSYIFFPSLIDYFDLVLLTISNFKEKRFWHQI